MWRRSREIPDPRNWVADLPVGLGQFIQKTTRKNPEDRFQDMKEALAALGQVSRDLGLAGPAGVREERKMMSLFLFYREAHRLALNSLLDEFSRKVKEAGIGLKAVEIKDIESE